MADNIKNILDIFVNSNPKIREKIREQKIRFNWEKLFGSYFDNKVKEFKISNNILEITISSSNLREDLFMKKERLILDLNQGIDSRDKINDILFY